MWVDYRAYIFCPTVFGVSPGKTLNARGLESSRNFYTYVYGNRQVDWAGISEGMA